MNKLPILFLIVTFFFFYQSSISAQLKVRDDNFIQIGHDNPNRTFSFGNSGNNPNNGRYSIESYEPTWGGTAVGGLNFWKPWPTYNSSNYNLFLRNNNLKSVVVGAYGSSSYKFQVYGTTYCTGGVWSASDERFKKNIMPLKNSLEIIKQLQGVSYLFEPQISKYPAEQIESETDPVKIKTMENDMWVEITPKEYIGFIAQDVEQIVPEAIQIDEQGNYAMNYDEIIPLLVEAVKEQQLLIDELAEQIERTKNIDTRSRDIENTPKVFSSRLTTNNPNPFRESTRINFVISIEDENKQNQIKIYDQGGNLKVTKRIYYGSTDSIEVNRNEIGTGIFVYSLVIDDEIVDSKTMICIQ